MGSAFDPELHLRLAGERAVVDPLRARVGPWETTLDEVAAALVALGALDEDLAQAITDDYQAALGLRGRGRLPPFAFRRDPSTVSARPAATQLHPARVVACEATLEVAGSHLQVHYVALAEERTVLAVSMAGPSLPPRRMIPGGVTRPTIPVGGHPPQGLQLTDDQGRRVQSHFAGGGSANMWHGELTSDAPLSVDTRWIDVGTERLVLGETPAAPPVEIEKLPDASQAERYLRSRLTAGQHGPHGGPRPPMIDVAVETLVEAGALAPDNPVIGEVRDVLAAFSGETPANPLVEPWASLLATLPTQSDWDFVLPLGVVTPELCGIVVAVDAVVAHEGVMEAHVRAAPGTVFANGPWSRVATSPLAWWATDDLGNHYLGSTGNWAGGPEEESGTIVYWPSLNGRARRLVLMPTAWDRRARIQLELPRQEHR